VKKSSSIDENHASFLDS